MKSIRFLVLLLFFLVSLLPAQAAVDPPSTRPLQRFFLMGSGQLSLNNLRNNRQGVINLLNANGTFNEAGFNEADRIFGFPTVEKGEHISPRLLFMLSYFSDTVAPGKPIQIESGYRSLEYNNTIRSKGANAARTSAHIDGIALDFWIQGVDGKQLWQTVRAKNCCGVGHYGDKTIHLDAGRPRFWEAATSGTKTKEPDYNRHIYLSTDFDRYLPKECIRLSLSGISDFGFGVQPTLVLAGLSGQVNPVRLRLAGTPNGADCIPLNTHKAARFLDVLLPGQLPAGRYTITLSFCQRPYEQMPSEIVSSEFEVVQAFGRSQ